jgi:hypothetical protein
MDPDWVQHCSQLDCGTVFHGKSCISHSFATSLQKSNYDLELEHKPLSDWCCSLLLRGHSFQIKKVFGKG